ncbi:hypothetical protein [Actinocorallia longicatena]|uniref:Uncharacterized protein n=1 Tax=Actinocorallia longicatena TaxID=111803 RepID=A0ABP6PWR7_9ACTN
MNESRSLTSASAPAPLFPFTLLGRAIEPELGALATEVVENIRAQVSELAPLFDGPAAEQAKRAFIAHFDAIMDGSALRAPAVNGSARRAHQAFVTGAFQQNLSLSSCQGVTRHSRRYFEGSPVHWARSSTWRMPSCR